MSATLNNLFNFSRPLPAPFDTLPGKKVPVSSKYGNGTQATLMTTVIKGVNAVCACMQGEAAALFPTSINPKTGISYSYFKEIEKSIRILLCFFNSWKMSAIFKNSLCHIFCMAHNILDLML